MKDFSDFAKVISENAEYFQNEALSLVDRVSENGVVNMNKLVAFLPSFNLKTCIEVLEKYHSWLHEDTP